MKKLLVVLMLAVFTSVVFATDAIYLNNGKILKGKITEETDKTIMIEIDGQWKEIKQEDIYKIVRDKDEKEEKTETKKGKSKIINTIKLGLDVSGAMDIGDDTGYTGTSITLTGDTVWPASGNIGLGLGNSIEFPRSIEENGFTLVAGDTFMFWPIYGIIQVSNYKKKGTSPYLTGQLGYNLFFVGSSPSSGLYLGIGGGITSKQKGFQAELLYAIHNVSCDVNYVKRDALNPVKLD